MNKYIGKQHPSIACPQGRWRGWYWKFFLLVLLGIYTVADAQGRMKVRYRGEHLEYDIINDEPCTRLTGNVVFDLEKCTIQADHAIYYKDRRLVEALGHVKITYQDGAIIVADQLFYDEENNLAKLRSNVIYQSDNATFYTDHFDYNTETKQGSFVHGGKLTEGDNVLTSMSGQYNDLGKTAIFDQDVELTNKDYLLQCNKLRYNTVTKIAQFEGTTKITSRDGLHTLTTHEGGEYDTSNQQSTFVQSKVETGAYTMYGDLLRVDQAVANYIAIGHVKLVAKEDEVVISGDYGQYQKEKGTAEVYGNALMTKTLEEDTLYLCADTFVATENEPNQNGIDNATVRAYHNVKLYKEDFQGKADSMVYQGEDSTIHFYGDPTFWSHASQLTADSVKILLQDKAFSEMHMDTHAFVASEDAAGNYNQLQGRSMIAYFKENKIDAIAIDGNAESIYFVIDDHGQLRGMNHLKCSQIDINIEEESIAGITFRHKPVGAFYPPHKIVEGVTKLKHFNWRSGERPTKQEVIEHGYGTQKTYQQFKFNRKH